MDVGDAGWNVLISAATAAITGPAGWLAKSAVERSRRRQPLSTFVEQDTAIIFGTTGDWASFPYYFDCDPEQLPLDPPKKGVDWWSWATANHGIPAIHSEISITLMPRTASTIAVDMLRVNVVDLSPAPRGCLLVHPVGGADIVHRQASIDFFGVMPPTVCFLQGGSAEPASGFTFALGVDEIAKLSITSWTRNKSFIYKWTALLDIVVAGKRKTIEVSNHGEPFVIHGGANCEEFEWSDNAWQASNHFADQDA